MCRSGLTADGDAETPADLMAETAVSIIKDIILSTYNKCLLPETLSEAGVEKEKLEEAVEILISNKKPGLNIDSAGKDVLEDMFKKAY